MTRQHHNKLNHPLLWRVVAGALKSAQDAHPEFEIPTPESIVKRIVGSLLAPEVRAALAVETSAVAPNSSAESVEQVEFDAEDHKAVL